MTEPFIVAPRDEVPSVVRAGAPVLGPLAEYFADERVTDVFVNGSVGLFVDRGGGAERDPSWRASEREVRDLAMMLIGMGGRHIDESTPCVDVRLADGVRVHAVLPPVATGGTAISLRIPRMVGADLDAIVATGAMPFATRERLAEAVTQRANVLITGAAGTGKTTLLGAMLSHASQRERIVTIEDVAELRIDHPHHVALESRQANIEGAGAVSLSKLVREALRMRPDRLVVGECRGEEIRELLTALNTGHDGGAGTVHANSLDDVPARLEALAALAGWDDRVLARQVVSAIDLVIHLERGARGARRIAAIGRFALDGPRLVVEAEAA